jgi:3D (Asp-Asp-Asp) domain-containing protein
MEHVSMVHMIHTLRFLATMSVTALFAAGCSAESAGEHDSVSEELRTVSTFTAKASAYFPDDSEMEGGFEDMRGKDLHPLQDFLKGRAPYVSVAMDKGIFKYGQRLRIRELNERYGKEVIFRVVDTGGAFYGKGRSRIDICVANETMSLEKIVNSKVTIDVIDESSTEPAATGSTKPTPSASYCRSDGDCNPGNNGSGKICVSKACVPGCKTNAQCPGVTSCTSGMCR